MPSPIASVLASQGGRYGGGGSANRPRVSRMTIFGNTATPSAAPTGASVTPNSFGAVAGYTGTPMWPDESSGIRPGTTVRPPKPPPNDIIEQIPPDPGGPPPVTRDRPIGDTRPPRDDRGHISPGLGPSPPRNGVDVGPVGPSDGVGAGGGRRTVGGGVGPIGPPGQVPAPPAPGTLAWAVEQARGLGPGGQGPTMGPGRPATRPQQTATSQPPPRDFRDTSLATQGADDNRPDPNGPKPPDWSQDMWDQYVANYNNPPPPPRDDDDEGNPPAYPGDKDWTAQKTLVQQVGELLPGEEDFYNQQIARRARGLFEAQEAKTNYGLERLEDRGMGSSSVAANVAGENYGQYLRDADAAAADVQAKQFSSREQRMADARKFEFDRAMQAAAYALAMKDEGSSNDQSQLEQALALIGSGFGRVGGAGNWGGTYR